MMKTMVRMKSRLLLGGSSTRGSYETYPIVLFPVNLVHEIFLGIRIFAAAVDNLLPDRP